MTAPSWLEVIANLFKPKYRSSVDIYAQEMSTFNPAKCIRYASYFVAFVETQLSRSAHLGNSRRTGV